MNNYEIIEQGSESKADIFRILVRTPEDRAVVLRRIESLYPNATWKAVGGKPTNFHPDDLHLPYGIIFRNGEISWTPKSSFCANSKIPERRFYEL